MEKVIIKNRKGQNVAVVVEENELRGGVAFVMHGLGGFKEQPHILTISQVFKEKGYTVVMFDTTNTIGESDGRLEFATLTNYYEDLEDVIKWAQVQKWYQEPFCLAGHSLGGFCVAWYTMNHSEKVKAVALISSVVSGKRLIDTVGLKENIEAWERRGYREWESSSRPGLIKKLNWSFVPDVLRYDLLERANQLKIPVVIIVGEKDIDTLPGDLKILYEKLSTKKEIHTIKGAPHTFKEEGHLRQIKNILLSWIDGI